MTTKKRILLGFTAATVLSPLALTGNEDAPAKAGDRVKIDHKVSKIEASNGASIDVLEVFPGVKVNTEGRFVDITSSVCLTKGQLEFIACTKNTKEHESIVTINSKPSEIHAALRLLGLKPGQPVTRVKVAGETEPKFTDVPAKGNPVSVSLVITQANGSQREFPVSHFVSHVKRDSDKVSSGDKDAAKQLGTFLFSGSKVVAGGKGAGAYLADRSGSVISLATFGDELLCLPKVVSNQGEQQWEVNPADLPKVGTEVILRLRTVSEK